MKRNDYGYINRPQQGPIYHYTEQSLWQRAKFCVFAVCIASLLLLVLFIASAKAGTVWTDERIAQAIYLAEGGAKAKVPYGILSVKVKDENEARRVCLNTIRNNRKRFAKQTHYTDFLAFLASRYAPVNCENDPSGLNKNWLKNVRYFLQNYGG